MRYLLTESDALLIKKKFNFGRLLGLNEKQSVKLGTERSLKKKGVIYQNNNKEELRVEYRALFSNWEKMQYSIVRPELNNRDQLQCLLSNERISMFFARKKDVITIDLFDFSAEKFDKLIIAFAEMENVNSNDSMFNLNMSLDDYEEFVNCKSPDEFNKWKKVTGIDASLLEKYVHYINTKDEAQMLLVEDHINDCGYMAKIVNTPDGIYAVKHVTHRENQKMVLLYGDTRFVTDSIYNF